MEDKCPNCTGEYLGTFCHACGQPVRTERITWKYFFGELQQRLFGFDNRFVRTVKDLTVRPEKVVRSTIEGIRVRYFGPLSYYFLLITAFVLLISFLEIDMKEFSSPMNFSTAEQNDRQVQLQSDLGDYIFNNFRIWSMLMIPFFIFGNYIIFKNKGYNYLENGVLIFYAMAHPMILSILFLFLYKFFDTGNGYVLNIIVSYTYICWVCSRFYAGNKIWNFIKGIFALLLSFALLMFMTMCVTVIYFMFNPEIAEQFSQ